MGEQDHLFLPSIKKNISGYFSAQLHVIKNCGHVVNVEQPAEFSSELILFLKSQDSPIIMELISVLYIYFKA